MLGGIEISERAREHAAEMLSTAGALAATSAPQRRVQGAKKRL
jgi:hypothetical protein